MRERTPYRLRGQVGAASLLAVGMASVVLVVFVGAVGVAQVALLRQRAALAADTAALAAAGRVLIGADDASACARAGDLVARTAARMTSCRVTGLDVDVEVAVPLPSWLAAASRHGGGDGAVRVRARAGPPAGTSASG